MNEVLAEAVRIEVNDHTGEVYIVFKIKSEKFKKEVIDTWTDDIDYKIIDKKLIKP